MDTLTKFREKCLYSQVGAACSGTPYPSPVVTGRKTKQTNQTHISENKFCGGEHLSTDTLDKKRKDKRAETGN